MATQNMADMEATEDMEDTAMVANDSNKVSSQSHAIVNHDFTHFLLTLIKDRFYFSTQETKRNVFNIYLHRRSVYLEKVTIMN